MVDPTNLDWWPFIKNLSIKICYCLCYIAISHPLSILFLVLLDSILFVLSELQVEYKLNLEPEVIALGALCILTDRLKWQRVRFTWSNLNKKYFFTECTNDASCGGGYVPEGVLWPMTLVCLPASATYTTPDDYKGYWEGYTFIDQD